MTSAPIGTTLVLGAAGAVGRHIVTELTARDVPTLSAGRRSGVDRQIDLGEPQLDSYRRALDGVDCVVNASGVENPDLLAHAADCGADFIDISAQTSYLAALQRLSIATTAIIDVGLAPGLTNLLAAQVHAQSPHAEIDIVVMLGAGEKHGTAATAWTYDLLGTSFDTVDGPVRNYSRGAKFVLPEGDTRRLYRTDFADQHSLAADLNVAVRTYFGLDSTLATTALAAATWIPGARRMPRSVPMPGSDGWLVMAQTHDSHRRWVAGRGQSKATAELTVAAVLATASAPAGVHRIHQVMNLDDLPDELAGR